MFRLEIETNHAAFDDQPEFEVSRILKLVASQLENGERDIDIRDVNGNLVGGANLTRGRTMKAECWSGCDDPELLETLEAINKLAQGKTSAASNIKSLWAIREKVRAAIKKVEGDG